jgi:hypothetical protein
MIDARVVEWAFERGRAQPWPGTDDGKQRLSALIKSGVAQEVKRRQSEVCRDCGTSHPVEQDTCGHWYTVCEAGRKLIDYDSLRQWTVDRHGLIHFIQSELGITQTADERLTGHFWYLGQTSLGAGDFPIWLVRDCTHGQVVSSIQDSLEKRSPGERGIVIVSSEASGAVRWIRDSASVRLSDALVFRDGAWSINNPPFHLHAPPEKTPKGRPGAPKKNAKDILQMFLGRVADGVAKQTTLKDEAEAIHALLVREVGQDKAQESGTIENIIRIPYGNWKNAGFPPPQKAT